MFPPRKDYPKILVILTNCWEKFQKSIANAIMDVDIAMDETPKCLQDTDHVLSESDKIYANIRFLKRLNILEMIALITLALVTVR